MKTKTDQELKSKFEAAIAKAVSAMGENGVSKRDLVRRFSKKGTSDATLYRWFDASMASGKPGQTAIRAVRRAAAQRAKRGMPVSRAVTEALPAVVRVEELSGTPTIKIIERLGQAIDAMDQLMTHARSEDGKVRNAKLLLGAADKLRSCLDTAVKIQQAMRSVDEVDRLHRAMIDEIAKCDRELAERVIRAMRAVSSTWSG